MTTRIGHQSHAYRPVHPPRRAVCMFVCNPRVGGKGAQDDTTWAHNGLSFRSTTHHSVQKGGHAATRASSQLRTQL